ncbi:ribonuclease HII [Methanoplanus endosymbiosus]|uniref:Ribonuclease HII n=1 Tax=Methanoplanus endosymbiosus TaxID=33865 RepID=A0A9E7PP13_9EURY|nr:ribonuclease HII [Methanoplanus endosymbiosus]UUX92837.1 ribonuclease HII [Methanoplanus endosymbiosus]
MICGIDEAGKGSVLGPMVIGGVSGANISDFEERGFADSKKLSPKRRESLYKEIKEEFKTSVLILSAEDIDLKRETVTMNDIVACGHASVIRQLSASTAYVDACDVNEIRYGNRISELLENKVTVHSRHKADDIYPVVAAASIVAKVTRDRLIKELSEVYGDIGSGYPSDSVTVSYLEDYIKINREVPDIARKSWKTVSNIIARGKQKSLFDF